MDIYTKSATNVPHGFFEAEALGLKWLKSKYGVDIVDVYDYNSHSLSIEKVNTVSPTKSCAYEFGQKLAKMHLDGAQYYGYSPSKYSYFGPLSDPVKGVNGRYNDFWDYYLNGKMSSILKIGMNRGVFTDADHCEIMSLLDKLAKRFEYLNDNSVAKVHGDLWSGNVLWRNDDYGEVHAVLIDPNAHGGHYEEDLAMLNLFGISYYDSILEGYESEKVIEGGFKSQEFNYRKTIFNIYPIAGHVVFFGGSYYYELKSMLSILKDALK